jgi:putative ABC transport system permease protein
VILALRDILRKKGRFTATSLGVGLLLGVVLIQAGIYRGVVADAWALPNLLRADLWVVAPGRFGPFSETTTIFSDARDDIARLPGVHEAMVVSFTPALAQINGRLLRTDVLGYQIARVTLPAQLVAGRAPSKPRYEAVVDRTLGAALGERIVLRDRTFDVVGLTERAVGINGKPLTFVSLTDARIIEGKQSPAAIRRLRAHGQSGDVGPENANAVVVQLNSGANAEVVKREIENWKHFGVISGKDQISNILRLEVDRVRITLLLFASILLLAATAIIGLTIYSMTADKRREIATLKLIGAGNSVIGGIIIWQSLAIGLVGYAIGNLLVYGMRSIFPFHMEIRPADSLGLIAITIIASLLASLGGVHLALRVPPNQALSG